MNTDSDILIIGGGVIGASIFYHLVSSGYDVTLLEKNTIASACTKASGGIVRCFHLDSSWCNKSVYGSRYYQSFKQHTGLSLDVNRCGFIYIPRQENFHFSQMQVQRLSQDICIEWLQKSDVKREFSHLLKRIPDHIVYEPHAFYISPIQATMAWMKAGQDSGGKFYEFTEVKEIKASHDYVEVMTCSGKLTAKTIVIAAGSHTPNLLDQLGYQHSLYKKNIRLDIRKVTHKPVAHPAFIDEETGLYGREDNDSGQFYIGLPTHHSRSSELHTHVIYQHGKNRFNWIEDSELQGSLESDDCYSDDGAGYIAALNEDKTIFIASGFSGGGFKIAPWVGNETVQLIKHK